MKTQLSFTSRLRYLRSENEIKTEMRDSKDSKSIVMLNELNNLHTR